MNIAVFGDTGYLGEELIKALAVRQNIKVVYTASTKKISGELREADVAIFALPHKESMERIPQVRPLMKLGVIDLSGAYRLKKSELYQSYYGWQHQYPLLLQEAVYGLPEKNRKEIGRANLIAAPGCYETVAILSMWPLIKQGLSVKKVWIDAISGFTGAGKGAIIPKSITAYKGGRQHQHIPVMEQELDIPGRIMFFPKVAPFPRGIQATIFVKLNHEISLTEVDDLYNSFYKNEPFVRIKKTVNLDDVIGTNFCDIMLQIIHSWIKLSVVIDNLGKGGSRQAIQILNIKLGLSETEGLL